LFIRRSAFILFHPQSICVTASHFVGEVNENVCSGLSMHELTFDTKLEFSLARSLSLVTRGGWQKSKSDEESGMEKSRSEGKIVCFASAVRLRPGRFSSPLLFGCVCQPFDIGIWLEGKGARRLFPSVIVSSIDVNPNVIQMPSYAREFSREMLIDKSILPLIVSVNCGDIGFHLREKLLDKSALCDSMDLVSSFIAANKFFSIIGGNR
jgi:hypothetical protein